MNKHRIGKHFGVKYIKKGKEAMRLFYKDGFARPKSIINSEIDKLPNTVIYASSTSLIDRLKANKCEICGATDCEIEIHHVRKLKNPTGKIFLGKIYDSKKSKNSGTLYLLSQKIAFRQTELTSEEPCTPRCVSTVWRQVFVNLS